MFLVSFSSATPLLLLAFPLLWVNCLELLQSHTRCHACMQKTPRSAHGSGMKFITCTCTARTHAMGENNIMGKQATSQLCRATQSTLCSYFSFYGCCLPPLPSRLFFPPNQHWRVNSSCSASSCALSRHSGSPCQQGAGEPRRHELVNPHTPQMIWAAIIIPILLEWGAVGGEEKLFEIKHLNPRSHRKHGKADLLSCFYVLLKALTMPPLAGKNSFCFIARIYTRVQQADL